MAGLFVFHVDMVAGLFRRYASRKLVISLGVSAVLFKMLTSMYQRYRLQQKLAQKKQQLTTSWEAFRKSIVSSHDEKAKLWDLIELDLTELKRRIREGELDPADLLHAFQARTLNLHDEGSSGVCEMITQAEDLFKSFGSDSEGNRSPLYGIPVSIKESFLLSGFDATCGLIKRCGCVSRTDSVIVRTLRRQGAIPFALTSTTQANRSLDGYNTIFGDVHNPHRESHMSGGSTAGECSLQVKRGSPVGIGSDIAGSIRIPAAFNALAGLKPTVHRLSSLGSVDLCPMSVIHLKACPGPIGRKVNDLADVLRTLLCPFHFNLDHRVIPLPFDEIAYAGKHKKQLLIGVYDSFKDPALVPTMPAIREVVNESCKVLRRAGHRVVQFQPPEPLKAYRLALQCLFADGGRELQQCLANEPLGAQLKFLHRILGLPLWVKRFADLFLTVFGYRALSSLHYLGGLRSAANTMQLLAAIRAYQVEFQKAWDEAGPLDAVVCPVSVFPAPPRSALAAFVSPSVIYTLLYNLVDYPAGTVPFGCVDRAAVLQSNQAAIDYRLDGNWYESNVAALQSNSEGLPLAVQVVGKPFHEETVLRVMRTIEEGRSV